MAGLVLFVAGLSCVCSELAFLHDKKHSEEVSFLRNKDMIIKRKLEECVRQREAEAKGVEMLPRFFPVSANHFKSSAGNDAGSGDSMKFENLIEDSLL